MVTGLPYLQRMHDRLAALPGVSSVGAINHLPLSGYSWTTTIHRADRVPAPGASPEMAAWRFVWGDYFSTMRIPLLAGRTFTERDVEGAPGAAIVNERLAREQFGSVAAAVGGHLVQRGGGRPGPFDVEVVGVVADVRHSGLDTEAPPEIYRPLQQTFMFPMQIVLRASGDAAALAAAVRQAAYEVDATVPVADMQTLPAVVAASLGRPRLLTFLLSLFAAIGALLCSVGLYGVVAVRVAEQRRDIGIRLALGASPRAMAATVLRQGLAYTAGGLALGIPASLALSRVMASVVFGVAARDVVTFTALPLLLLLVTVAACSLPARRAASTDPVRVMRAE
jgi:putative ABC transport system permease protein